MSNSGKVLLIVSIVLNNNNNNDNNDNAMFTASKAAGPGVLLGQQQRHEPGADAAQLQAETLGNAVREVRGAFMAQYTIAYHSILYHTIVYDSIPCYIISYYRAAASREAEAAAGHDHRLSVQRRPRVLIVDCIDYRIICHITSQCTYHILFAIGVSLRVLPLGAELLVAHAVLGGARLAAGRQSRDLLHRRLISYIINVDYYYTYIYIYAYTYIYVYIYIYREREILYHITVYCTKLQYIILYYIMVYAIVLCYAILCYMCV